MRDRSYIRAQPNYVSEQMLRTPPPKRVTVKEELVDQKADPVTGYARLGYVGQVRSARPACLICSTVHASHRQTAQPQLSWWPIQLSTALSSIKHSFKHSLHCPIR